MCAKKNKPLAYEFKKSATSGKNPSPDDEAVKQTKLQQHINDGALFRYEPHIAAMMKHDIVLAPLVLHWRYRVLDAKRFQDWLVTRDIIFNSNRLDIDCDLAGMRYGGTYFFSSISTPCDKSISLDRCSTPLKGVTCLTVWGFRSQKAINFMNGLYSSHISECSIVQNDLLNFIRELKTFIKAPLSQNFTEDILISASAADAETTALSHSNNDSA